MTESECYIIRPTSKKSSYTNEHWVNCFDDVVVRIIMVNVFRWSEFEINLTPEEKEEIMNKDNITLNDYDSSFISSTDGCERYVEIPDFDKYPEHIQRQINESIYENIEDEYLLDDSEIEENGWDLSDSIYEIYGGIELELSS